MVCAEAVVRAGVGAGVGCWWLVGRKCACVKLGLTGRTAAVNGGAGTVNKGVCCVGREYPPCIWCPRARIAGVAGVGIGVGKPTGVGWPAWTACPRASDGVAAGDQLH